MKYATLLPWAAAASAFVIPSESTAEQLVLKAKTTVTAAAEDLFDQGSSKVKEYMSQLDLSSFDVDLEIDDFLSDGGRHGKKPGRGGRHGKHGKHGHATNLTAYEAIKASPYSTKFAKFVDEFPDIVDALNSTKLNVTVFVPTDKAFDKIPDHHKDKELDLDLIKKVIQYHIVPAYYPAGRVLASSTLPTALKEDALNGNPQRLRASVGLFGVRLNFYSKVVAINIGTTNGVLHAVDSILIPPPDVKTLVSLFPQKFSQLLLAGEKTGLSDEEYSLKGLTFFAPTNWAFTKLGPRANAFLFNTEKGAKYLKALILYHTVVDETLYSDAYYSGHSKDKDGEGSDDASAATGSQRHIDLPTALDGKHLSVDIARYFGFVTIKVNGFTKVTIQDGVARDGVVHAIDSVLIPPHEHKGFWSEEQGAIEVDDLMERLEPFVEGGQVDL